LTGTCLSLKDRAAETSMGIFRILPACTGELKHYRGEACFRKNERESE